MIKPHSNPKVRRAALARGLKISKLEEGIWIFDRKAKKPIKRVGPSEDEKAPGKAHKMLEEGQVVVGVLPDRFYELDAKGMAVQKNPVEGKLARLSDEDRSRVIRLAATLPKGHKSRPALLRLASRMKFRPFTKMDWMGMSGMVSFGDGTQPYIADFEGLKSTPVKNPDGTPDMRFVDGQVVVGREGVGVIFYDAEGNSVAYMSEGEEDDPVQALRVAEVVAQQILRGKLPRGMKLVNDDRR